MSTPSQLIERDRALLCRPGSRIPIVVAAARGDCIVGVDGREYTDLTSGWNVANTGWAHPRVVAAASRAILDGRFAPSWCTAEIKVALAERLAGLLGEEYAVIPACTGTDAVEFALRAARKITGRTTVVGFREAYHGSTLGAGFAGGVRSLHEPALLVDHAQRHANIPHAGWESYQGDVDRLVDTIRAEPLPAAVLIEAVFTNPGVLYGRSDLYERVRAAASEVGALVIVDEIGTGFGRTGALFAFLSTALEPDIVTVGKAFSSGVVPMAGTLLKRGHRERIAGPAFDSTFAWTVPGCHAAMATLDVIESERLADRAQRLGREAQARLCAGLASHPGIADVRGRGLELGVELGEPMHAQTACIQAELLARGVFAEWSRFTTTLLIMPPLTIDADRLDAALDVVVEVLRACETS